MTKTSAPPTTGLAAMEGGGFYNKHSSMQAAGNASLLPHWAKMVREVALDGTPIVVADYGSSQGRNSMAPMRMAIEGISARTGAATPIQIVHTDLPTNDFAVLFSELSEPSSYMAGVPDVYPSAIGRSYFEQILPANSVHLGWNTWTLHWLSGEPIDAPDHAYVMLSQDTNVLARLKQRQADDNGHQEWNSPIDRIRVRAHDGGGLQECARYQVQFAHARACAQYLFLPTR